jgi:hypothetical protein
MRLDEVGGRSKAKLLHKASFGASSILRLVSLKSTLGVVTFATGAYVEDAAATKARAAIFSSSPAADIIMVCSEKTAKLL